MKKQRHAQCAGCGGMRAVKTYVDSLPFCKECVRDGKMGQALEQQLKNAENKHGDKETQRR